MSYVQYGYRMRSAEEVFVDLQRFVGFARADLELNRKGQLTARQQSAMLRRMTSTLTRLAVTAVSFLAWYLAPADAFEILEEVDHDQLILIPILLLGYTLSQVPWRMAADMLAPHIDIAEGKGDVEMRGVNDHISLDERRREWAGENDLDATERDFADWEDSQQLYHLRVDGVRFPATKRVVNSIEEGHRYRAFYLRHSHRLLSIEPVQDNASPPPVDPPQ